MKIPHAYSTRNGRKLLKQCCKDGATRRNGRHACACKNGYAVPIPQRELSVALHRKIIKDLVRAGIIVLATGVLLWIL